MKAIDQQWEAAGRPGSIEIKISPLRFNAWCIVFLILLMVAGTALFVGLHGRPTAYDWGHILGTFFSYHFLLMLPAIVALYLALDALMLWLMTDRDRRSLHWHCDAVAIGFYSDHPIRLDYFRLILLAPTILLGLVPAVCGLLTGHAYCYAWGLWSIACALFDLNLFYRLRHYPNNTYYLSSSKSYTGWVIARGV